MVIQRIQTLMLLIAAIMTALFCLLPYGTCAGIENPEIFIKDTPALLALNIAIAALLVINIFMYKNLRQQMRMLILTLILICASAATSLFVLSHAYDNAEPILLGGVSLLVLALLAGLLAYRGMRHDRNLLRSADRLR